MKAELARRSLIPPRVVKLHVTTRYKAESGDYYACMQGDGNLCVYKRPSEFKFGTVQDMKYGPKKAEYYCVMQDDGNLCVYEHAGEGPAIFKWGSMQSPKGARY